MSNKEILELLFSTRKAIESKEGKEYLHALGYLDECIKWISLKDKL
jgi:hypothetical protein